MDGARQRCGAEVRYEGVSLWHKRRRLGMGGDCRGECLPAPVSQPHPDRFGQALARLGAVVLRASPRPYCRGPGHACRRAGALPGSASTSCSRGPPCRPWWRPPHASCIGPTTEAARASHPWSHGDAHLKNLLYDEGTARLAHRPETEHDAHLLRQTSYVTTCSSSVDLRGRTTRKRPCLARAFLCAYVEPGVLDAPGPACGYLAGWARAL